MVVEISESGIKRVLFLYTEIDVSGTPYVREENTETSVVRIWPKGPGDEELDEFGQPSGALALGQAWVYFPVIKILKKRLRRKTQSEKTITPIKKLSRKGRRLTALFLIVYEPGIQWKGAHMIVLPRVRVLYKRFQAENPGDTPAQILIRVKIALVLYLLREMFKLYKMKDPRGENEEEISEIQINWEGLIR